LYVFMLVLSSMYQTRARSLQGVRARKKMHRPWGILGSLGIGLLYGVTSRARKRNPLGPYRTGVTRVEDTHHHRTLR